jgi:hypothetical protein
VEEIFYTNKFSLKYPKRREKNERKICFIDDGVMFNYFLSFGENFFCSGREAD